MLQEKTHPANGSIQAYATRDQLLAPVNAILQLSDMLLEESRETSVEGFRDDLEKIQESGRRLLDLIREVFDPSRVQADPSENEWRTVQSRIRHDVLNALNPIINYSEMWLEEEESGLTPFADDLREIHRHGKFCEELISRLLRSEGSVSEATEDGLSLVPALDVIAGSLLSDEVPPDALTEAGRILVVDDNATNRDILCRRLTRQGHEVSTVADGRQALDRLRSEAFDLVLLDILMPEMNGFQVLQHLKEDTRLRHVPVIMISALDQTNHVARCIRMGAEDYLSKPFDPVLLQARIGACLEKKRLRDRDVEQTRQIKQEKRRADELLHVILPGKVVKELKETNAVKPRRHENVAVLFADIVGFTSYCDRHSPEQVVRQLQEVVQSWEEAAIRHGVQKIKTIGDAFMAASGLLNKVENPVLNCVRFGQDMIATVGQCSDWKVRVGIHIGPVVAGVLGRRQYLFDLWGDTVNTAARMETNSLPGRVTLSEAAWSWISAIALGDRALVAAKGKGEMAVYRFRDFAEGIAEAMLPPGTG